MKKQTEAYLVEIEFYDDTIGYDGELELLVFGKSYKNVEKQVHKEFKGSNTEYDIVAIEKLDAIPIF